MYSHLVERGESLKLFQYEPSLHVAVIFAALFAATTLLHLLQLWRSRAYCFVPFVTGGLFETAGYIVRALTQSNQHHLGLFLTQTLLLLLGPAWFATSIYMVLGRVILFTKAEHLSPIYVSWLTKMFICGDVLSFLVQSAGGGLMAQVSTMNVGKDIVVIGLVLQILFFGIFSSVASLFHYRIFRCPTAIPITQPWQQHMCALYIASFLILTRSLFRIAEFMDGHEGHLMRKEWYLYVFDSVLMLGVMVCFNVIHPGRILGKRERGEELHLVDVESLRANICDHK